MLGATALGVLIAASAMVAEAQQMAPAGAPAAAAPPPVRHARESRRLGAHHQVAHR